MNQIVQGSGAQFLIDTNRIDFTNPTLTAFKLLKLIRFLSLIRCFRVHQGIFLILLNTYY